MNHLKALLLAGLMTIPSMVSAEEYPWLIFCMTDNSELSVATDNIDMTFAEGKLVITSAAVNQTLSVANIKSMMFSTTESTAGIEGIESGDDETAEYFTTTGVSVGIFSSRDAARSQLPSGVYIGKTAKKSFKVIF